MEEQQSNNYLIIEIIDIQMVLTKIQSCWHGRTYKRVEKNENVKQ